MQYSLRPKFFILLVLHGILVLVGSACSDPTGPQVDSATNWLVICDAEAQCDGGAKCVTGVCSLSCEASSEPEITGGCAAISPSAECVSNTGGPGHCDQRCTISTDCTALGDEYGCFGGFCRVDATKTETSSGSEFDISGAYAFRVVTTAGVESDAGVSPSIATETSYGVSAIIPNPDGDFQAIEALCYSRQGDTLAHLDVIGSWPAEVLRRMPEMKRGLGVEPDGTVSGTPVKRLFGLAAGVEVIPDDPADDSVTDPDQDGRPGLAIRWQPADGGAECVSDLIGFSTGDYSEGGLGLDGKLQHAKLTVQLEEFQMLGSEPVRCAFPAPPAAVRTHEVTLAVISGISGDSQPPACPTLDEMMQLF